MKKTPPKAKSVSGWASIIRWAVWTWLFFLELLVIADESREMSLEYFLGQGLLAFKISLYVSLYLLFSYKLLILAYSILGWLIWKPLFLRGVGPGIFVMLIAVHVLKWDLNAFSPFQKDLAWLMISLDLFCAVAIVTCAFLKNRLASVGTFWLACNIGFFNLATLANDVNGWEEVRFLSYFAGILNLPFLALFLSKLWRNDKKMKKTSISSSKKIKDK